MTKLIQLSYAFDAQTLPVFNEHYKCLAGKQQVLEVTVSYDPEEGLCEDVISVEIYETDYTRSGKQNSYIVPRSRVDMTAVFAMWFPYFFEMIKDKEDIWFECYKNYLETLEIPCTN